VEFGGAVFYLSDEAPALGVLSPPSLGAGSSSSFVVLVADADAFIARAVDGGAVLERPVDEGHGTRSGWIRDPFGHRWNIGTPLRDPAA
jgi:PhnB protein